MLPDRLTWIDETNRDQYHFLQADDRCLFFGDFFSGKGWTGGPTNQLIKNYKRTPSEIAASPKAKQLQYYKDQAIGQVATALRKVFRQADVECRTFVPIPSSKIPGHPDYCDRLERTLRQAFHGYSLDIRTLLRQSVSTDADHRSGGARRTYDELLEITEIVPDQLVQPLRAEVVFFDDVLTSGKHFRVARARLQEARPGQHALGLFIARSIHANPFEAFNGLDA